MKRKILTIALFAITLTCLFAIGVGAAEKTLDTNSLDEIKATINESSVGDEITVNLTGDMISNSLGCMKPILQKLLKCTLCFSIREPVAALAYSLSKISDCSSVSIKSP